MFVHEIEPLPPPLPAAPRTSLGGVLFLSQLLLFTNRINKILPSVSVAEPSQSIHVRSAEIAFLWRAHTSELVHPKLRFVP